MNVFAASVYVYHQIELAFASEQIDTFIAVANERPPKEASEYISGYYLPGTKLSRNGPLSAMVETVRGFILSKLAESDRENTRSD